MMKRIVHLLAIALSAAVFATACDPTNADPVNDDNGNNNTNNNTNNNNTKLPSEEIQQADYFAALSLSTYYLWVDKMRSDISKLDPETCFDPITVVHDIRYHANGNEVDHWTQLTDDLKSMTSSVEGLGLTYGYDLQAGRISNKDGVYFLIVGYVVKDSPAEKAGLKRGDIIMTIDGADITISNIYDAFNTAKVSLGIAHLTSDGYLGQVEKEVSLAAVDMWEDPILLAKTFDVDGKKVGYLIYNSFDVKSMETLPDVFRQFKADGVEELILDLRYNGGGFVITECELASLIAPYASVAAKDVYQTEIYNDLLTEAWKDEDSNTYFDTKFEYKSGDYDISVDISDANPGIKKLYVIVSGGSASASEGLIVGLTPYMDMTLVGERTYGKYCAGYMLPPSTFKGWYDDYFYDEIGNWGIYVMVSTFADKNGSNQAMPDGIPADIEVEDNVFDGYQLGDEEETMLKAALKAAGKTYAETKASAGRARLFPTEHLDHGAPRGMLIKTDLPRLNFSEIAR